MGVKLALIIGNSVYRDETLARLKAPDADVGALADVLLDQEVGGFQDAKLLVNLSAASVRRAIANFYASKARDDLLLLYFSGHGVLDDQGRLYLAVKDTERSLLRATGIPAAYITDEMNNSRSQRQVLILDCCHSGAFARGAKGATGASVGTATAFEGSGYGRVVLTATDATQYAWEGEQIIGEAQSSLFTHHLINGISSGAADLNHDGRISVDELYDYTYGEVVRLTPQQTPGKWSYKEQGEIIIAATPQSPPATSGRPAPAAPAATGATPARDEAQEEKINQLYTRGLAAYHLGSWEKAASSFEDVLRIAPEHAEANAKLTDARQQAQLAHLEASARQAEAASNWKAAILAWETLLEQAPEHPDAASRLVAAHRRQKLADLYAEAHQLFQAGEWRAVVGAFKQINSLQPGYPDPEGLLESAKVELAAQDRRGEIEMRYRQALAAMEIKDWEKAQALLSALTADEPGYEDTTALLEKATQEARRQRHEMERQENINSLYQEATRLANNGSWRAVLETIEQIRRIDPAFPDPQELADKALVELEKADAEKRRRIELEAGYNEAAALLDSGQYQQALEAWRAVQHLDPAYPDARKIEATASKKLRDLSKPAGRKISLKLGKLGWSIIGICMAVLLIGGGLGIYYAFFAPPAQKCSIPKDKTATITSGKRSFSVTLDGKFSSDREWSDATCVDLYLGKDLGDSQVVGTRWYVKNDAQWLYVLVRVPKTVLILTDIEVSYMWQDQADSNMGYSDSGQISHDPTSTEDYYGWDEQRWYEDGSSPNQANNDVKGATSEDEKYIYLEFRKPLNSGEVEDWAWQPGTWVGTGITGDLLFAASNEQVWYSRYIKLHLSE